MGTTADSFHRWDLLRRWCRLQPRVKRVGGLYWKRIWGRWFVNRYSFRASSFSLTFFPAFFLSVFLLRRGIRMFLSLFLWWTYPSDGVVAACRYSRLVQIVKRSRWSVWCSNAFFDVFKMFLEVATLPELQCQWRRYIIKNCVLNLTSSNPQ